MIMVRIEMVGTFFDRICFALVFADLLLGWGYIETFSLMLFVTRSIACFHYFEAFRIAHLRFKARASPQSDPIGKVITALQV